jgi:GR25 family glycosyltransferase involved in LPS biosynthesis
MKIQEFFKEAFYINLDDRTDRLTHMNNELSKHGLHDFVKRYSAVSVEVKTSQECMIASGTSHRNLIQYAKDNNLENILILEDDVFFKEGGMEILEKSLDSLNKKNDWDIYYFSANIFDNPLNMVDDNLLIHHGCYCVHAYGVHKRAYDRLLEYNPRVDPPIDSFITQKPFRKYGGYPFIASQIDSVSDNIGGFIGYDEIFTKVYDRPVVKHY